MHQIEKMAYVGIVPWHGLGNQLQCGQSIEEWREKSGMAWNIEETCVEYQADPVLSLPCRKFPGQKVLYRSDDFRPLAVVSERYKVVQPSEVLDFYRDLTSLGGFELETAGVLKGGRKFWALARTGQTATLRGRDRVEGYLLLATACDGTLSTTAQFTSVRVVCNNTLAIALNGSSDAVKVSHRSDFDADAVKRQLSVAVSTWDTFVQKMYSLSNLSIGPDSVDAVLASVFDMPLPDDSEVAPKLPHKAISRIRALYQGDALGASLASSSGTAWGLLNSITEYVDHHRRARNNDYRIDAAWFGVGAQLKRRAWDATVALID